MDAAIFLRLTYVCDGKLAHSTVLWDLLLHHKAHGLDTWRSLSASDCVAAYSSHVCSERSFHRAMLDLAECGWLEMDATIRNSKRRFRLRWLPLLAELESLSVLLPGLPLHQEST